MLFLTIEIPPLIIAFFNPKVKPVAITERPDGKVKIEVGLLQQMDTRF